MTRLTRAALALALTACACQAFAQSISETRTGPAPAPTIERGTSNILWDNSDISVGSTGLISTIFGGLPTGSDRTNIADEFVVPVTRAWTITRVDTIGFTNQTITADAFEIIIYSDAGGAPGQPIATRSLPLGGSVTMDSQQMTLANPIVVPEGTHWISVAARYDTAVDTSGGRWNWFVGATARGSEWHLQDPAALFGGLDWTSATDLGLGAEPSASFVLYGTSIDGSLPVPTMSPAGLGAMLLVMLVCGLLVIRRLS